MDLVLKYLDYRRAHLVLSQQLLELLVVRQDVEDAQSIHRKVDVPLVVLGQRAT